MQTKEDKYAALLPQIQSLAGGESRSEIVVPVRNEGKVVAVLDIDSKELGTFDSTDAKWLEKTADCIFGPGKKNQDGKLRDIWFAAGCFWGAQKFFKLVKGVESTEVGFANGAVENPTYKQVYTDTTGHAECVHVRYNPELVSLEDLTKLFFRTIDPLSLNRQGEDEGTRYRTGVYYEDEMDYGILREEFARVEKELGCRIAVELGPLKCFYKAEEYHQNYLDKTPGGYCHLSPEIFRLAAEFKKLQPKPSKEAER